MKEINPYYNVDFLGFFYQFFYRIFLFLKGDLSWQNIAPDEVQLIVLSCIAASSALIGTFLVLRRMAMLANSLSHTILLGIVLAFVFTSSISNSFEHSGILNIKILLIASVLMGFLTVFLTEWLTKKVGLQEDASIGLVFTSLFALGIILATSLTRNMHLGIEAVMGNVDALHQDDISLAFLILIFNLICTLLFFKENKITTFDPGLANALGFSARFFSYLLMMQASLTVIGAFRAVGVLMVLAFITGPVLTARLLTNSLGALLITAIMIGIFSAFMGVAIARHLLSVYGIPLSTGGLVVCTITLFYLIAILYKYIHAKWINRPQKIA